MKYKKGTFVVVPIENLETVPPTAQALLLWLCKFADEDGTCFPARKKLATLLNVAVRTVDTHIALLVEAGIITKTLRSKKGSKENMSNLYQIMIITKGEQILHDPLAEKDTTPLAEKDTVTISNSNYTNLTQLQPEVVQEVVAGNTLPLDRGKTPILRLLSIYKDCFRHLYGFSYKPNFGRDLKVFKELLEQYTELQLARLLVAYFNWNDNSFLLSTVYSIQVFKTYLPKLEAHVRNIEGEPFDDEDNNLTKVGEYFVKVINIDKVAIK